MSNNRWMDKDVLHFYNEILFNHKKTEILQFVTVWMVLEGIMLSEVGQRKTNTIWFHLYMESKKQNNEQASGKRLKHREQTGG